MIPGLGSLTLMAASSPSFFEGLRESAQRAVESGSWLAPVLVFAAGVLTSFTPCVYPVVPLTVGYIGAASGGSKWHGFTLSLSYVLGMAVVYTALGLVLTQVVKTMVGALSGNMWVNLGLGNLFLLLALSMLGLFELKVPAFLADRFSRRADEAGKRGGYVGAFMVGAVSALVVGPCTGPVLAAILTMASGTGSLLKASLLMFSFSLGLGALLVLAGTFAGLLASLPRSGPWMKAVKVFFGLVLLGTAEYFIFKAGAASF